MPIGDGVAVGLLATPKKLYVGPHVLLRERVEGRAYYNGTPHNYRWRCKYCDAAWPVPDSAEFTRGDCEEFENSGVPEDSVPDVGLQ